MSLSCAGSWSAGERPAGRIPLRRTAVKSTLSTVAGFWLPAAALRRADLMIPGVLMALSLGCLRAPQPLDTWYTLQAGELRIPPAAGELDTTQPRRVFAHVFRHLPPHIQVMPTENYVYFSVDSPRGLIRGNLRLDAQDRDRGVLHFACYPATDPSAASVVRLTQREGIYIRREADLHYSVGYGAREVRFLLNNPDLRPLRRARLHNDERLLGTSHDESGFRFLLVFGEHPPRFLWLLDEMAPVPDVLEGRDGKITVGRRTRFAFWRDEAAGRNILVGVSEEEAARNTSFDGPFDQLPDNHIYAGKLSLRKYILAAMYPPGAVDDYGHLYGTENERVAIAPYCFYRSLSQFAYIAACRQKSQSAGQFYRCLSRPPRE